MQITKVLRRARPLLARSGTLAVAALGAAVPGALASGSGGSAEPFHDATPTDWHRLARAESLLSAPEPDNPVAVCVVDSGVNITPDLEGVVIERLAYDGGDPGDTYPQEHIDDGHGTYVATFLAGQVNGWGSAGTWPRAKVVSVRVFPPGGTRTTAYAYSRALDICAQRPAVGVVNLSLGGLVASPQELRELEERLADIRARGLSVVAAAGNAGTVESPATAPGVIAVSGVSPSGRACARQPHGENVDLVAAGCELRGADRTGQPVVFDGSSFAAPQVAAGVAALRGYAGLSAQEAEAVLLRTGLNTAAGRLVQVHAALDEAEVSIHAYTPSVGGQSVAEYRVPRPRAQCSRRKRGFALRLHNRPLGVVVEVRLGSRTFHRRADRFRLSGAWNCRIRVRFRWAGRSSTWVRPTHTTRQA